MTSLFRVGAMVVHDFKLPGMTGILYDSPFVRGVRSFALDLTYHPSGPRGWTRTDAAGQTSPSLHRMTAGHTVAFVTRTDDLFLHAGPRPHDVGS